MVLVDDLKVPVAEPELARRRFLQWLGLSSLGVGTLSASAMTIRFMEPRVIYQEDLRFVVGRPEDIAPGTVLVLTRQKIYVVRTTSGFVAMTAVCTHLGCITRYQPESGGFACPCHGSRFSPTGEVVGGPAPDPLPRLEIALEKGLLVVDAGKRVAPDAVFTVPA